MQLQTILDNCLIEGENSTLITSAPCTVNVGQLRGLIQEGELDAIHVRLLDLTEAHVSPTNQTKSREISRLLIPLQLPPLLVSVCQPHPRFKRFDV